MKSQKKALIVIDVQNDFCPGGSLPVKYGDKIIPVINRIMDGFDIIIGTQDWHPQNQISFASNHKGKNPNDQIEIDGLVQVLWPDHCVQGTAGAEFHKDLNSKKFNMMLRKGTSPKIDSYSAFMENDKKTETGLHGYIKALKISDVYFCGLATDYCVYYSAIDSVSYGFSTHLIIDACAGIDFPEGNIKTVITEMKKNGIIILNTNEL
jgi:nicotinamidase/pyrazinamidase